MGFPIQSSLRVCPTKMVPNTGTNMTTRFNPILLSHIYGKSVLQLVHHQRSLYVGPGHITQVSILWVFKKQHSMLHKAILTCMYWWFKMYSCFYLFIGKRHPFRLNWTFAGMSGRHPAEQHPAQNEGVCASFHDLWWVTELVLQQELRARSAEEPKKNNGNQLQGELQVPQ